MSSYLMGYNSKPADQNPFNYHRHRYFYNAWKRGHADMRAKVPA